MLGSTLIAQLLERHNVRYVFGAPGTSELSLVGEVVSSEALHYIFAFHDGVATGMADGYARGSGNIGIVNLHAAPGTLNALGFLRVAQRDAVPIMAIVGLPSTTYAINEPNHYVRWLETCIAPLVKWSWMARNMEEVGMAITRGLAIARSLPCGPTLVGIPQDLLETNQEGIHLELFKPIPLPVTRPSEQQVEEAASLLLDSRNPLLFLGHGIQRTRSREQAIVLAELAGASVVCEALDRGPMIHGVYFPVRHSLFRGFFSSRNPRIRRILLQSDVIVFVGCKANYPRVIESLPPDIRIIQIDADPLQFGKSLIPDVVLWGHPGLAMLDLAHAIRDHPSYRLRHQERQQLNQEVKLPVSNSRRRDSKLSPRILVETLFGVLPEDSIVVDDSQCLSYFIKNAAARNTVEVEGSMASHIGWALPAALGIKMAQPRRLVVAVISDGSALFSLSALPTAASLQLPILIVVANNRSAMSLRLEAHEKGFLPDSALSPLTWSGTFFNFAVAAQAFGFTAKQAITVNELKSILVEALSAGVPYLIDAVLPTSMSHWAESWAIAKG
jgi:benzoylformate decarboxylase